MFTTYKEKQKSLLVCVLSGILVFHLVMVKTVKTGLCCEKRLLENVYILSFILLLCYDNTLITHKLCISTNESVQSNCDVSKFKQ